MTGAFTYLILTSARGRVRAQLARLRNPRYAIALVFGLVYVWGVYLRPRQPAAQSSAALGSTVGMVAPLLALVYVSWTWIFGADRTALAFSEAEATMLFSAPVSRRALVMYKIARAQIAILTTSIIWTLIFRQGATLPLALTHVVSYWVVLSTLNLNRLGVALVRASSGEHGLRGTRRHWLPIALFTAIVAMVAVPLAAVPARLAAAQFQGGFDIYAAAMSSTSARLALFPFQLLLAPFGAAPGLAWIEAIVPALLILVLMTLWVLYTDAAFEEAASEASTRQAQRLAMLRARRAGTVTAPVVSVGRTIPLAPTGAPAVALLWKNAMWLLRTGQLRGLVAPPAIAFICIAVFARHSERAAMVIAVVSSVIALVLLVFGPMSMRNDLRSELLHLSLLKTLPLRGRDIVLAEVSSSVLPVAIMEYLLVLAALVSLGYANSTAMTPPIRFALALAAPVLLLGLSGAVFTIHNALALFFPGWVKLGATGATGIETIGMGMMTMLIVLVMLALMLVVPVIAAGIAWSVLRYQPSSALFASGLVAGLLLLAESVLLSLVLGGALDRIEPMQVG